MGTRSDFDSIGSVLFGKARRAVLALLLTHADEEFYLRQIVRLTGLGLGSVQRELSALTGAGIARRTRRGRQVFFRAHHGCPVFAELKSIITKTAGTVDVLRTALSNLEDTITCAFVYGSVARGTEAAGSDLDLMVIGAATFAEVVSALPEAQHILCRDVNPSVYPEREFVAKLKEGHHFIRDVMAGEKLFVMGGEDELEKLGR